MIRRTPARGGISPHYLLLHINEGFKTMKTPITQLQSTMIRTLVRRANRRIERATEGQRRALEYYIKKETGGEGKFSAAVSGLSFVQARRKIEALERFLNAKSTTRKGWEEMKAQAVKTANETLGFMGYDLTDKELAIILQQIDTKNGIDYYAAIDKVVAAKNRSKNWEATPDQIAEAISEKMSPQKALKEALIARGGK